MAPPRMTHGLRQTAAPSLDQRLSLRLLGLSAIDLEAYVREQVESNPFLEARAAEGGASARNLAPDVADNSASTLLGRLAAQLPRLGLSRAEVGIARRLFEELDEDGYMRADLSEFAREAGVSEADALRVLSRLQELEPCGVFARDLAECLALQLRARGHLDPIAACVLRHLPLLARRDFAALAQVCSASEEDIRDVAAEVRTLAPRPGALFSHEQAPVRIADVIIRPAAGGRWDVALNAEAYPAIAVDRRYFEGLRSTISHPKDLAFAAQAFRDALSLQRAVLRRSATLFAVATELAARQSAFLLHGPAALAPLDERSVADALGVHASTVSRTVVNKWVSGPRGIFAMRAFFSGALNSSDPAAPISTHAVRHRIGLMIGSETDPRQVLSDQAIVVELRKSGIEIARRTVMKYREAMGYASSHQRRRRLAGAEHQARR